MTPCRWQNCDAPCACMVGDMECEQKIITLSYATVMSARPIGLIFLPDGLSGRCGYPPIRGVPRHTGISEIPDPCLPFWGALWPGLPVHGLQTLSRTSYS